MNANQIGLKVYRRWSRKHCHSSWKQDGFSLDPGPNDELNTSSEIDLLADDDNGLAVYLFDTIAECDAFRLGLESAGEDTIMSASGNTNLECPGVIREIDNLDAYRDLLDSDDEDGRIVVVDHRSQR